jgi:aconitate hydratase
MGTIVPAISGPKRPQDYVALTDAKEAFAQGNGRDLQAPDGQEVAVEGEDYTMESGKVVIASITSCTNTSNPYVMIGAGLVARKAAALGLNRKPWVKTSLAPGSQVVSAYLEAAGLQEDLDKIGFNLVGYGCTTCIGNSGPLQKEISEAIAEGDLVATSVLSGNRNFEGRISPDVRANYLASPPLVVAYALAGTMDINLATDPIAQTPDGKDVYLKDIWPTQAEIAELVEATVTREAFIEKYADVFKGDEKWQGVEVTEAEVYDWPAILHLHPEPALFPGHGGGAGHDLEHRGREGAGDPGRHGHDRPHQPGGVVQGHHARGPLPRGTAGAGAGVQLLRLAPGQPRGHDARHLRQHPYQERDARRGRGRLHARARRAADLDLRRGHGLPGRRHPLVVFGGEQYGAGSSRDWAAKGTNLLGVKAVIAESFERIHRSNLVGMGVIPFEFTGGDNRKTLGLKGDETVAIHGLDTIQPLQEVPCTITYGDGSVKEIMLKCRIDTAVEIEYIEHGGVLHYVLRNLAQAPVAAE